MTSFFPSLVFLSFSLSGSLDCVERIFSLKELNNYDETPAWVAKIHRQFARPRSPLEISSYLVELSHYQDVGCPLTALCSHGRSGADLHRRPCEKHCCSGFLTWPEHFKEEDAIKLELDVVVDPHVENQLKTFQTFRRAPKPDL